MGKVFTTLSTALVLLGLSLFVSDKLNILSETTGIVAVIFLVLGFLILIISIEDGFEHSTSYSHVEEQHLKASINLIGRDISYIKGKISK